MAFIKHVGKHGDRKVCIMFRQVPGEEHMSLIIYPETLPAHWQQAVQSVLESDMAQQSEELADALHRNFLPDGRPILQTLHEERMIKKVRNSDIIVTPNTNSKIRLDELNKMLNEMKLGEEAIKKMARTMPVVAWFRPKSSARPKLSTKQSKQKNKMRQQLQHSRPLHKVRSRIETLLPTWYSRLRKWNLKPSNLLPKLLV
jgi:hypothetical protein